MEKVTTYLEMLSPGELEPSQTVPDLALRRVDGASSLLHEAHARVGGAYRWRSAFRTTREWQEVTLARPLRQYWLIMLGHELAGVAATEPQDGGDVEITTFGLVPEYVGKNLGGPALTLVIRQAWASEPVGGAAAVRRVWLHTCSYDHPNALRNYQRRGMRVYRTEVEHAAHDA